MYCGWTGIYVQSSCANVETYRLSFLYRCFVFLMVVAFATGKWGNWQVNRKNKTHMYKVLIRLQLNSYCYKSQARGWNKNRSFDSSSGEFLRDKIELFFSLSLLTLKVDCLKYQRLAVSSGFRKGSSSSTIFSSIIFWVNGVLSVPETYKHFRLSVLAFISV